MKADELLPRVEAVMAAKGLSPTKFGLGAIGDPNLVKDLKKGRELRSKTAAKVLAFLAEQEAA